MRQSQYTLDGATAYRLMTDILTPVVGFWAGARRCTPAAVVSVLAYAAARLTSISGACARLVGAPGDDAVHKALTRHLNDAEEVERRLQAALIRHLPRCIRRRRKWDVAMDTTLVPYHGEHYEDESEVSRGQAKSGTTHFHSYATAYLVCRGRRFTLALMFVAKDTPPEAVVAELRRRVSGLGISGRKLLLDRGFCEGGVIRYLQHARQPFIIPQAIRGRAPRVGRPLTGLRLIRATGATGWQRYTYEPNRGRRVSYDLCVVRRRARGGRKRTAFLYACWGVGLTPQAVREAYRRRFGIETGYRQMHQARAMTTSRRPALRLLLVGVAVLLRNLWVWLHWAALAERVRGGRRVDLAALRLQTLLLWLAHLVEIGLGVEDETPAQVPISQRYQDRDL